MAIRNMVTLVVEQFDKDGNFIRYTTKPISNTQRYKMIGNGMTVSIIAKILEGDGDIMKKVANQGFFVCTVSNDLLCIRCNI